MGGGGLFFHSVIRNNPPLPAAGERQLFWAEPERPHVAAERDNAAFQRPILPIHRRRGEIAG